jgi:hypothetical protein
MWWQRVMRKRPERVAEVAGTEEAA